MSHPSPILHHVSASAASGKAPRHITASNSPHERQESEDDNEESKPRKRQQITVACNECRKRKIKCNGARPTCHRCESRGCRCDYDAEPDVTPIMALKRKYEQLQVRSDESDKLLDVLRSRSDSDAIEILRRFRSGDDLSVLLAASSGRRRSSQGAVNGHGQDGHGQSQGSQPMSHDLDSAFSRPQYPRFSKDPANESSSASFTASPTQSEDTPMNQLQNNMHPNQDGFQWPTRHYETNGVDSYAHGLPFRTESQLLSRSSSSATPRHVPRNRDLSDSRLARVKATDWGVHYTDDETFADIISNYLRWDHAPCRLFDEGLFLDDLVSGSSQYCCKLLVHCILAYGCKNYTSIDAAAAATVEHFALVEAKKIWYFEEERDQLTSIPAGLLLQCIHMATGKDKTGSTYAWQAIRMAKALGLLVGDSNRNFSNVYTPREARARSIIAWGLYNQQCMIAINMREETRIRTHPAFPVPRIIDSIDKRPWDPHPMDRPSQASNFDSTSNALSELCVIANEMLMLYEGREALPENPGSIKKIEIIYQSLLVWAEALLPALDCIPGAAAHVLTLHMHFHQIVVELFRRCISTSLADGSQPSETRRSALQDLAYKATRTSVQQLKELIYQYYRQFPQPPASVFIMSTLILVAFDTMPLLNQPESRFQFCIVIKMLNQMKDAFAIAKYILLGIHQSVKRREVVPPAEARFIFDAMERDKSSILNLESIQSTYPLDLALLRVDKEAAQLGNMIRSTTQTHSAQQNEDGLRNGTRRSSNQMSFVRQGGDRPRDS